MDYETLILPNKGSKFNPYDLWMISRTFHTPETL